MGPLGTLETQGPSVRAATCGSSLSVKGDVPLLFLLEGGRGLFYCEEEPEEAMDAASAPTPSSRLFCRSLTMDIPLHEVLGPRVT